MNPTNHTSITETNWFVDPENPLMEWKFYTAKVDNMVHTIAAKRGVMGQIPATDEVRSFDLGDSTVYEDNSVAQFNKLVKFIDSPK